MRLLFNSLLLLLLPYQSFTQSNFHQIPFDSTVIFNGHWAYGPGWNYMDYYSVFFIPGEDTLMNEMTYSKVFFAHCGDSLVYRGAIRNEASKSFFVSRDEEVEFLLYDFDPISGQELNLPISEAQEDCEVGALYFDVAMPDPPTITEILGVPRQSYSVSETEVIEGIGPTAGFLSPTHDNVSYRWNYLHCMSTRDSVLYYDYWYSEFVESPDAQACFPVLMLDVAEREYIPFKLFPNPAIHEVSVQLDIPSMVDAVELINARGESIAVRLPSHLVAFNVSELPPGCYLIRVWGNGIQSTQRFLVE